MNERMWEHPATQANVAALRERGVTVLVPGSGRLATHGEWGTGRLPEPAELLAAINAARPLGPWSGMRTLVTAGGTREPIDAVRYLGNRSSGRMGFAIADAACARGSEVVVVAANVSLPRAAGVRYVEVATAAELAEACEREFDAADVLVMCAAVADFRPAPRSRARSPRRPPPRCRSSSSRPTDVLAGARRARREGQTLVGFAAEHGDGAVGRAREKLVHKRLDAIVCNDVSAPGIGFDSAQNAVTIITADGEQQVGPRRQADGRRRGARRGRSSARVSQLPLRRLGRSGPTVSAIGLGCMAMSGIYGPADERESIATIHAALDAGITLLDTGDFYGMGHNELLIRDALAARERGEALISVKFGALRGPDNRFAGTDGRPVAVANFLAYSLRRLGTDEIDIYRPARLAPDVPIEETVGAIAELVKAGYVRHIGLSEVGADTLRRAQAVHPICDVQLEYSLLARSIEDSVLRWPRAKLGIAVTAYGGAHARAAQRRMGPWPRAGPRRHPRTQPALRRRQPGAQPCAGGGGAGGHASQACARASRRSRSRGCCHAARTSSRLRRHAAAASVSRSALGIALVDARRSDALAASRAGRPARCRGRQSLPRGGDGGPRQRALSAAAGRQPSGASFLA